MARSFHQPPRASVREDELAAYDCVVGRQASYGYATPQPGYEVGRSTDQMAGPYFSPLLQSPLIAAHLSELGAIFRSRGEVPDSFSHRDREWVDIVLGHELGFNMWPHVADGLAVGLRPDAIVAVVENRLDDLDPRERLLADHILAVSRGRLTDEGWSAIEAELGRRGAVEYTAWIGHLLLTIRLCQAFITNQGQSDEEIVRRVRGVVDGSQRLPDPKARVVHPSTVSWPSIPGGGHESH